MPIPERPEIPSLDPRFRLMQTDDGSRTLVDIASGDSFHSGCGAAAECRHVYLENSGSGPRLRHRLPTSVLEFGFGTGMAFVLTAAEAHRSGARLDYVALEQSLLPAPLIGQVLADPTGLAEPLWGSEFAAIRTALVTQLAALPAGARGEHSLELTPRIRLRLVLEDAAVWQPGGEERFDAIYFDPFSPASNPRLWEPDVLQRMERSLLPKGRLVSYCVNRAVRDRLESVGFQVRRVPGPPAGKREVLIAERK